MINAVIYARFSSDRQQETSIAAQVRACQEYAAGHDMRVVNIYKDEAKSGKESAVQLRAGYQQLLQDLPRGLFSCVLIHKYDRLARSVYEQAVFDHEIQKHNIKLVAVAQDFGDTAEGGLSKGVQWVIADYYSKNLANETRKGLRETALKAEFTGGVPPFGYDIQDKHYVINETEAYYVRQMFNITLRGGKYGQILAEMEAKGVKGKRGKVLKYPQIYEILRNEKYTGVYLYSETEEQDRTLRRSKPNAIRIENAIPAIITRELFDSVQRVLSERKRVGVKSEYLCSGLVYCGECGAKMHIHKATRKGHTYIRYRCSDRCGAPGVPAEEVDGAAVKYLSSLFSEEAQAEIIATLKQQNRNKSARLKAWRAENRRQLEELEARERQIIDNISTTKLAPSIMQKLAEELEEIDRKKETIKNAPEPVDMAGERVKRWFSNLNKGGASYQTVHGLIESITIKTNEIYIQSTLNSLVNNLGCGGSQHILLSDLPGLLFGSNSSRL